MTAQDSFHIFTKKIGKYPYKEIDITEGLLGKDTGGMEYPGLIMIDSPAAQEIAPEDLRELLSGLKYIRDELPHLQIFVAGVTSKAMTDHVPESHRREATNGGYLW